MDVSTASSIAGFLDGVGSSHFRLVRQKEYRFGFYIRASVSFSQSTSARPCLERIQTLVGGDGYKRDRATGMSDSVNHEPADAHSSAEERRAFRDLQKDPREASTCDPPATRSRQRPKCVPASGTRSRCICNPKLFKDEANSAVDVEQHLRSKGVLCPCNDFFVSNSEEMAS
jgi:hypothetical protein